MVRFLHTLHLAVAVLASSYAAQLPSFAPLKFPPSTIDNDGTSVGRYDVRKTMAFVDPNPLKVNAHYFLLWVTTVDGGRYQLVICPTLRVNFSASFVQFSDLNADIQTGATLVEPGSGSNEYLNFRSQSLNLTSPAGGDNFTDMYLSSDSAGVKVNFTLHPTGKNVYIGGSGGFSLVSGGLDDLFYDVAPGWTWYWANPTLRIEGCVTINDKCVEIDAANSVGWLERQWGAFSSPNGYIAHWLYLSNGIRVHIWIVPPPLGYKQLSIATVWHPDGLHEVVEVDDARTKGYDEWTNEANNSTYFTKFKVGLANEKGKFTFAKQIKESELTSLDSGASPFAYNISEAYMQGTGFWEGKPVTFFGHTEQFLGF